MKAAIERGQSQMYLGYAEREQARTKFKNEESASQVKNEESKINK